MLAALGSAVKHAQRVGVFAVCVVKALGHERVELAIRSEVRLDELLCIAANEQKNQSER